jgi:hypothetical protein
MSAIDDDNSTIRLTFLVVSVVVVTIVLAVTIVVVQ